MIEPNGLIEWTELILSYLIFFTTGIMVTRLYDSIKRRTKKWEKK